MANTFTIAALNSITTEQGLTHAVLESLFSDEQAYDWQAERFGTTNTRGWCLSNNLNNHGSKLWLLLREKTTAETESLLLSYINKSLSWINDFGSFKVITEILADRINFQITVNYGDVVVKVDNGN